MRLREQTRENLRRAAECALLGPIWLLFSLPLVTSGAAWLAVARVCVDWTRGVEPPLLATFVSTIRRQFRTGLALQAVAVAAVVLPYLDARFALAAGAPGGRAVAVLLAVLGAAAVSVALLSAPIAAAGELRAGAALRRSLELVSRAPWAAALVLAAVATSGVIVSLLPVLGVVMAGPVGFAVVAVWSRGAAQAGIGPHARHQPDEARAFPER